MQVQARIQRFHCIGLFYITNRQYYYDDVFYLQHLGHMRATTLMDLLPGRINICKWDTACTVSRQLTFQNCYLALIHPV